MSSYQPPPGQGVPWQGPPLPQAVPPRPSLSPRQVRSAATAGGWGVVLLSVGGNLILVAVFGLVLAAVVRLVPEASVETGLDVVANHLAAVVAASVGSLALGVVGLVGGVLICHRILRSGGHARPWAVTAAGEGIAVVALGTVSTISSFGFSLLTSPLSVVLSAIDPVSAGDGPLALGYEVSYTIVSTLVTLVLAAACGALACWMMAIALRGPGHDVAAGR